jgi:hypothetical protein
LVKVAERVLEEGQARAKRPAAEEAQPVRAEVQELAPVQVVEQEKGLSWLGLMVLAKQLVLVAGQAWVLVQEEG